MIINVLIVNISLQNDIRIVSMGHVEQKLHRNMNQVYIIIYTTARRLRAGINLCVDHL
jgi:hypothetical protein